MIENRVWDPYRLQTYNYACGLWCVHTTTLAAQYNTEVEWMLKICHAQKDGCKSVLFYNSPLYHHCYSLLV